MPLFGAHMSIAGGYYKALLQAQAHACDTVQLFTKNNNQWYAKELTEDDIRTAVRRILAGLEPVFREEPPHERRGLRLRPLVRRDRGETAVLFQRLKGLFRIRFHPSEDV